jgi:hypothetical protein
MSLQVDHGKVRFNYVPGGVNFYGGDAVQNNDTANVSVQTWLSRLQANLTTPGGIEYTPDPGHTGSDTLTVTVNDNGNTGTGPAYQVVMDIPIQVYSSDLERWRHSHFDEADLADPLLESSLWGHGANPDFDAWENLFEYLLSGDPLTPEPVPLIESGYDGVHLWMRFLVRHNHSPVNWWAEWSPALDGGWSTAGVLTTPIEAMDDHDLMEVKVPMVDPGGKFFRLQGQPE